MIDQKKIEYHIKGIIEALGDDPNREGLKETPKRVATMYTEIFKGMEYNNEEIADLFNKTFEEDTFLDEGASRDLVFMKDIEIFSHCEHHLALMYNMKVAVAYLPNKKIIGLSKIARICDMVSRRLQLQERIGQDIADVLMRITDSEDVAVIIQGEHACMTTRGIKMKNAKTMTTTLKGKFADEPHFLNQLLLLYGSRN